MSAESIPSQFTRFPRPVKWLIVTLLVLLLLLSLLVAFMPLLANVAAVHWLQQQGVDAQIKEIDIDFNDARISVQGAAGKNSQGRGFSIEGFYLDLAWRPLLDRQLHIEAIEVNGLQLDLLQDRQGLQSVAGLDLGQQPVPPTVPAEQDASAPWGVELGDVSLRNIEVCDQLLDGEQHYCLRLAGFEWRGRMVFDAARSPDEQLQIKGGLHVSDIIAEDRKRQQTLVSAAIIKLSDVSLRQPEDISIAHVRLDDYRLFPGKTALDAEQLAGFDRLQIDDVDYKDRHLKISQLSLAGAGASLYRNKQGQMELQERLQTIQPAGAWSAQADAKPPAEPSAEPTPDQGFTISIDSLAVNDSDEIQFVDDSLQTPFSMALQIKQLSIQDINTAKADQFSKLGLHVVTDKHGSIKLQGSVQLVAEARSMDVEGTIQGLDLRPVSSYIETGLGRRIKSGQLNAQIKLHADKGVLDSLLDLELQQLQLKKGQRSEQQELDQDIGLPLDTALNLLRERDNSIKLKIPVTGDVNSPNFDASNAIRKATSAAITVAVINYYTPLGLFTAVEGMYNLATALRFEPVVFTPGTLELSDAQTRQLEKIVQLMSERPAVNVTLCGFSNRDDVAVVAPDALLQGKDGTPEPSAELRTKLIAVAGKRAGKIRDYLVDRGIAAHRLILCEGELSLDGISGVEISL
jgi:hypothetical protein